MSSLSIKTLTCSPKYILLVFYTDKRVYQYRVINSEGKILGTQEIYYTENGAEKAARSYLVEQNFGR